MTQVFPSDKITVHPGQIPAGFATKEDAAEIVQQQHPELTAVYINTHLMAAISTGRLAYSTQNVRIRDDRSYPRPAGRIADPTIAEVHVVSIKDALAVFAT